MKADLDHQASTGWRAPWEPVDWRENQAFLDPQAPEVCL